MMTGGAAADDAFSQSVLDFFTINVDLDTVPTLEELMGNSDLVLDGLEEEVEEGQERVVKKQRVEKEQPETTSSHETLTTSNAAGDHHAPSSASSTPVLTKGVSAAAAAAAFAAFAQSLEDFFTNVDSGTPQTLEEYLMIDFVLDGLVEEVEEDHKRVVKSQRVEEPETSTSQETLSPSSDAAGDHHAPSSASATPVPIRGVSAAAAALVLNS